MTRPHLEGAGAVGVGDNPLRDPMDLRLTPPGVPVQPEGSPVSPAGFPAGAEGIDPAAARAQLDALSRFYGPMPGDAQPAQRQTLPEHGLDALAQWRAQNPRLANAALAIVGLGRKTRETKDSVLSATRAGIRSAEDVVGIVEEGHRAAVPVVQAAVSGRTVRRSGDKRDKLALKVQGIQEQIAHEHEESRLGHAQGNMKRQITGALMERINAAQLRRAENKLAAHDAKHAARQTRHGRNQARADAHLARIDRHATNLQERARQ